MSIGFSCRLYPIPAFRGTYSFGGGPVSCRSVNKEMKPMKKPVLVLLALLALLPCAQLLAQAPPAAGPPAKSAAAPAPGLAQFLATLSDGQAQAPTDLVPAPSFMPGCG